MISNLNRERDAKDKGMIERVWVEITTLQWSEARWLACRRREWGDVPSPYPQGANSAIFAPGEQMNRRNWPPGFILLA